LILAESSQPVWSPFHHKTALALVRTDDTISVEAIQPANLSRRPAPKQDEHGA
jgi:hypothetical protein